MDHGMITSEHLRTFEILYPSQTQNYNNILLYNIIFQIKGSYIQSI